MSSKKGNTPTAASSKPSILKLTIPAGGATPSPPIGPALGQKGVKAIDFCRQFNDSSKDYIKGTPLRCQITVNPDRTFQFDIRPPSTSWLLKRAAGVEKGNCGGTVAHVDRRVIYEVSRVKAQDPKLAHVPLKYLFRMILAQARNIGFRVF